jgi:hypothetical protein
MMDLHKQFVDLTAQVFSRDETFLAAVDKVSGCLEREKRG